MTVAAVKVALRIRPMTATESLNGATECLLCVPNSNQVVIGISDVPQRSFTYDYAFAHDSSQDEVFACVQPLVDEFVSGFNATVLAYGQTGTYSVVIDRECNSNIRLRKNVHYGNFYSFSSQ